MENETGWEASSTLLRAVHQGRGHHGFQSALAIEVAVLRVAAHLRPSSARPPESSKGQSPWSVSLLGPAHQRLRAGFL